MKVLAYDAHCKNGAGRPSRPSNQLELRVFEFRDIDFSNDSFVIWAAVKAP